MISKLDRAVARAIEKSCRIQLGCGIHHGILALLCRSPFSYLFSFLSTLLLCMLPFRIFPFRPALISTRRVCSPQLARTRHGLSMAPKRKRVSVATAAAGANGAPLTTVPIPLPDPIQPTSTERISNQGVLDPNARKDILDAPNALRASPDAEVDTQLAPNDIKLDGDSDSPLSDVPDMTQEKPKRGRKSKTAANGSVAKSTGRRQALKSKQPQSAEENVDDSTAEKMGKPPPKTAPSSQAQGNGTNNAMSAADPEADNEEEVDEEEVKQALSRPPPVNSDYLPLPWKGRLGFVRACQTSQSCVLMNAEGLFEHVFAVLQSAGF